MDKNNHSGCTILSFIKQSILPYKVVIALQIIIQIMCAAYASGSSYVIKNIIDVVGKNTHPSINASIIFYACLYLGFLAGVTLLQRCYNWLSLSINPLVEQSVIHFISQQLMSQQYHFYQDQFAGSLANNARILANSTVRLIEIIIERMLRPVLTLLIGLWTLYSVGIGFSLLLLGWFLVFCAVSLYAAPYLKSLSETTAAHNSKVIGQIVDVLTNILSIKLFSTAHKELEHIDMYTQQAKNAEQKKLLFLLKLQLFQSCLFISFVGISLYLLLKGYKTGLLSAGDFALVLIINDSMNHILWRFAQDIAFLYENIGYIQHGLSTLINHTHRPQSLDSTCLILTQGAIKFENVYFNFHKTNLFVDISLTIPAGQKVGLVGYSGSGKSTFVNLILRLFSVQQGAIFIDEQDIKRVSNDSLRAAIAFIPQNPILFQRSIFENIAYGNPQANSAQVHAAAKRAHADEFIRALDGGYDMNVGQAGNRLSGGQRQRIAIARAYLKNAPILILDEATSQLDAITQSHIQESLAELMLHKTTLVIAHRLSTVATMDRILVFDKGTIVQDGTHHVLLSQEGIYKTLWQHQNGSFLGDQKEE